METAKYMNLIAQVESETSRRHELLRDQKPDFATLEQLLYVDRILTRGASLSDAEENLVDVHRIDHRTAQRILKHWTKVFSQK